MKQRYLNLLATKAKGSHSNWTYLNQKNYMVSTGFIIFISLIFHISPLELIYFLYILLLNILIRLFWTRYHLAVSGKTMI